MSEVTTGSELWDRFLRQHGISHRTAAKALQQSPLTIRAWRKGFSRPNSDDKRVAIEVYSGGAVPKDAWLKLNEMHAREHLEQVRPFDVADPEQAPPPSAA